MNQTVIRLHRGPDVWYATTEGRGAERIRQLFGTTTLPTPFLPSVPAEEVAAEIRRRNPGAQVVVVAAR